jgi:transposase
MPAKLYHVKLTKSERQSLEAMSRKGSVNARQLRRARILLLADAQHSDEQIIAATGASPSTVQRIRQRWSTDGVEAALSEKPRPGAKRKLDARAEARLTALACSTPPEGYARWTLRLLADTLVELEIVDAICHQSVANVLKKTTSSRGRSAIGASER